MVSVASEIETNFRHEHHWELAAAKLVSFSLLDEVIFT